MKTDLNTNEPHKMNEFNYDASKRIIMCTTEVLHSMEYL